MTPRNYHIPSRDLPKPRHTSGGSVPNDQQAATAYLRHQIAQIYDGTNPKGAVELPTTLEAPQQKASTQAPEEYAHTYREEPTVASQGQPAQPQYDWQTYHSAWQQYYQQYYQRYYLHQQSTTSQPEAPTAHPRNEEGSRAAAAKELKSQLVNKVQKRAEKAKASPHFKPIITAVIVGLLFLFLQFNRTLVAQAKYYISPGTLTNEGSSIIINPETLANVGQDPRIIIPKINVDVPVVYDEPSYDEHKIQKALEKGVVHYGNSAMPGQIGNNVIVGHSSNDLFDGGGYKFAFVLIDRLNNGDVFMLNYQGKRYVYKVYNKAVINPSDFSLININPDKPVITLVTCTPPGTALKRLLVQAEQISPAPDANQVASQQQEAASLPSSIPGNSPTLFERIKGIFN